ncbi:ATP-binding protein [Dactylosporangium sp. NPDC049525]|uniref:ATP-binding protein n=1 Tax=Dactylosporangium sp. NPDC049525 TaxID=3154730 RepID=UPI00341A10B7
MTDAVHLQMSLDLPRESAGVGQTRRMLDGALAGAGVEEDCRDDIRLALSEACSNVIKHADLATTYHVDVSVDGDLCVIEVTDDGGGFDPSTVRAGDVLAEAGRGLQMVAAVVDGLDVVSVDGTGTLLRFTKQLTWNR